MGEAVPSRGIPFALFVLAVAVNCVWKDRLGLALGDY